MSLIALSLLFGTIDPTLQAALQRALTREQAQVTVLDWEAPLCRGDFAPAPFDSSGRVAVRVRGTKCEAWGWAQVRVVVPVATLTRDVKNDGLLDGAWTVRLQEPRGTVLMNIAPGATATRALRKGNFIAPNDIRSGPKPGTAVTVRVMMGALSLEQRGTVSPCSGNETCATLPSGKKVSGRWVDGALEVGGGS